MQTLPAVSLRIAVGKGHIRINNNLSVMFKPLRHVIPVVCVLALGMFPARVDEQQRLSQTNFLVTNTKIVDWERVTGNTSAPGLIEMGQLYSLRAIMHRPSSGLDISKHLGTDPPDRRAPKKGGLHMAEDHISKLLFLIYEFRSKNLSL